MKHLNSKLQLAPRVSGKQLWTWIFVLYFIKLEAVKVLAPNHTDSKWEAEVEYIQSLPKAQLLTTSYYCLPQLLLKYTVNSYGWPLLCIYSRGQATQLTTRVKLHVPESSSGP